MVRELRSSTRQIRGLPDLAVYIAGEDMSEGAAVAQSRNTKDRVLLADANDGLRMPCIGVLGSTAKAGREALIIPTGMFVDLARDADFSPGDIIYVSQNRGRFTRVQPPSGTVQIIGRARNSNSALIHAIPTWTPESVGFMKTGNHTMLVGTMEQFFAREGDTDEFSVWHHGMLWVSFDVTALVNGTTIMAKLYHMIDGTDLKQIASGHVKKNVDKNHLVIGGPVTSGMTIGVSLQVSVDETSKAINHVFIQDS